MAVAMRLNRFDHTGTVPEFAILHLRAQPASYTGKPAPQ
ncbi:hypothetical protein BKA18_006072 [Streptomyces auratus]